MEEITCTHTNEKHVDRPVCEKVWVTLHCKPNTQWLQQKPRAPTVQLSRQEQRCNCVSLSGKLVRREIAIFTHTGCYLLFFAEPLARCLTVWPVKCGIVKLSIGRCLLFQGKLLRKPPGIGLHSVLCSKDHPMGCHIARNSGNPYFLDSYIEKTAWRVKCT